MEGEKIENRPTHPGELVWFSRSIGVQRMRRRTTTVPHWSELLCHLLQNNGCIMIPFMGYLARYPSIKTHYGLMVTRTCPFNIQTYVWCVWKLKERNVSAWPLKCNSGYLKIWWVSKSAVSKVWVNLRRAQIKPLKRGDRQTQHMYSEVIPRRRQERTGPSINRVCNLWVQILRENGIYWCLLIFNIFIFKKWSDAAGNGSRSSPLDSYAAQDPGELISLGEENSEIHDRFFPITRNFFFPFKSGQLIHSVVHLRG